MLVTKQLLVAIDFQKTKTKKLWKSMATVNHLLIHILQNIFVFTHIYIYIYIYIYIIEHLLSIYNILYIYLLFKL